MGWAYLVGSREKLTVQAVLNHAVIGEAAADLHRADLAAVGLGDGNCGYHITFYKEIDPLYLPFVAVKLEGGDLDLPRSAASGYVEFFDALYCRYPVTGRHRSVFGGLWTDRIDASALLKGRVDIGAISLEQAGRVSDFIGSGFAVVPAIPGQREVSEQTRNRTGRSSPGSDARRKAPELVETVCGMLDSRPVLDFLHAVLEGPPVALSATIVEGKDASFTQPSVWEVLPSPAECIALVQPLGDTPAELEVVRHSHLFPEFSADGKSRWVTASDNAAIDVALRQQGMVERFEVAPGSVAMVGPGLINRVLTEPGTSALQVLCTPSRHAPLDRLLDRSKNEVVLEFGARVWI
jgi:hypothetical protein